ncbi:DEAD/DEAH box helicase family protein, partial [Clostridium novyi]|uniref:DEAD/DEAH box helicase family protein n=1 Tax=Clostridium novyi TaxID=1542 RepID=UPI00057C8589
MEDIFDYDKDELIDIANKKNSFAEKWFIKESKLDDDQKSIYKENETYNFIVTGCAGSGKTILAIHKLIQILGSEEKNFDSYLFTVYTKALLEFIKDGFNIFLEENEEDRKFFDFNIDKAQIIN